MSIPAEAYRVRSTILSVEKGLHIFRYESAEDEESPPFFIVAPIPDDVDALEYMSDNTNGGNLCKPGDYLIIKAKRQIKVITTKGVYGGLGKEHVELSFMPLDTRTRQPSQTALPPAQKLGSLPSPSPAPLAKVALLERPSALSGSVDAAVARTTSGTSPVRSHEKTEDVSLAETVRCSVRVAFSPEALTYPLQDLPSTFGASVKSIAFATDNRRLHGFMLTAFYSDGRQNDFVGREVAATALGQHSIIGVRLQSLDGEGVPVLELVNRLFSVAATAKETHSTATQQRLVRRRVGVVMDL